MMTHRIRKFALTLHITSSVGWLGAVIGFIVIVVAALTSQDTKIVYSAMIAMEIMGWYAIVPLALTSFLSGLVMSLGTAWGLIRHFWVLIKLMLTILATIILLLNMQTVSFLADVAVQTGSVEPEGIWGELLHAGGGLLVLILITILSVYRPKGMTRYGLKRQQHQQKVS